MAYLWYPIVHPIICALAAAIVPGDAVDINTNHNPAKNPISGEPDCTLCYCLRAKLRLKPRLPVARLTSLVIASPLKFVILWCNSTGRTWIIVSCDKLERARFI